MKRTLLLICAITFVLASCKKEAKNIVTVKFGTYVGTLHSYTTSLSGVIQSESFRDDSIKVVAVGSDSVQFIRVLDPQYNSLREQTFRINSSGGMYQLSAYYQTDSYTLYASSDSIVYNWQTFTPPNLPIQDSTDTLHNYTYTDFYGKKTP